MLDVEMQKVACENQTDMKLSSQSNIDEAVVDILLCAPYRELHVSRILHVACAVVHA